MDPAKPPLPTPMNLPFQFWMGSQSSMLIKESDVGVSVTCTRQCAGMFAGGGPAGAGVPPRPVGRAGGGPSGAATALVTLASANVRLARLSHGVEAAMARVRSAPAIMLASLRKSLSDPDRSRRR